MDVAQLVIRVMEIGPPEELTEAEEDHIARVFEAAEEAAKKALGPGRFEIGVDYD